eukprot:1863531-Amphidinium_carterae.1
MHGTRTQRATQPSMIQPALVPIRRHVPPFVALLLFLTYKRWVSRWERLVAKVSPSCLSTSCKGLAQLTTPTDVPQKLSARSLRSEGW